MISFKIIFIIFFIIFWIIAHIAIGFPKYSEKEFDLLTDGYELKKIEGTKIYKKYPRKTSLKIDHKIFRTYNQYENFYYETHTFLFLINSVALFIICTKF